MLQPYPFTRMIVNSKFEIKNLLQLNIDGIEEILDMPVMGDEIGEPKLSAGKEQNPNYSDSTYHCRFLRS